MGRIYRHLLYGARRLLNTRTAKQCRNNGGCFQRSGAQRQDRLWLMGWTPKRC